MDDYPSNSLVDTEPEIEKVISGNATIKKKSGLSKVISVFISEDVKDIPKTLFNDIVLPAFQKMLYDSATEGVKRLFWGNKNVPTFGRNYLGNNPEKYWIPAGATNVSKQQPQEKVGRAPAFETVAFDDIMDAKKVLHAMNEIVDRQGIVSVHRMHDLAGVCVPGNITELNYGWSDLRSASVKPDYNGRWYIDLPKALPIPKR